MTIPAFSDQAMSAYAALYQAYNDIDIYVEDRSLIGLYEFIFKKILGGALRVYSVTPLNGRTNVEAEARRLERDTSRKRFFLIDGDFDWVHASQISIRDVYQLRCYSLENLAWDYVHITEVAQILAPELTSTEVIQQLPPKLFLDFVEAVHPLFVLYAVCSRLGATCTTVKFSLARLIDRQTHVCDGPAIRQRKQEIYRHLLQHYSKAQIRATKADVENAVQAAAAKDGRFISGKDYLIQFLMFVMQDRFRYRGNRNQLLGDILSRSSFSIDPGFAQAVLSKVGGTDHARQSGP